MGVLLSVAHTNLSLPPTISLQYAGAHCFSPLCVHSSVFQPVLWTITELLQNRPGLSQTTGLMGQDWEIQDCRWIMPGPGQWAVWPSKYLQKKQRKLWVSQLRPVCQ